MKYDTRFYDEKYFSVLISNLLLFSIKQKPSNNLTFILLEYVCVEFARICISIQHKFMKEKLLCILGTTQEVSLLVWWYSFIYCSTQVDFTFWFT